jgi:phosphatidylglycerophosphate synthase
MVADGGFFISWLPNAISLLRLVLGVVFPWLPVEWRLPVIVAAAITDGLDGQASRWLRAESKLGVILDPIADKVFFLAVVATLVLDGTVSLLEVILISLRDLMVLAGAGLAWLRDGPAAWRHMKPRWPGKLATVLQFIFLGAVLLDAESWRGPLLWTTAVVSGLAGLDYILAYLRQRRDGPQQGLDDREGR